MGSKYIALSWFVLSLVSLCCDVLCVFECVFHVDLLSCVVLSGVRLRRNVKLGFNGSYCVGLSVIQLN